MSDSSLSDVEEAPRMKVTRRSKSTKPDESHAAIAELRRNKNLGLTRAQEYELDQELQNKEIYDVVEEAEYQDIVRQRREQAAFVVDDDGTGYMDHGEEVVFRRKQPQDTGSSLSSSPAQPSKKRRIGEYKISKMLDKQANKTRKQMSKTKLNKAIAKETTAEQDINNLDLDLDILSSPPPVSPPSPIDPWTLSPSLPLPPPPTPILSADKPKPKQPKFSLKPIQPLTLPPEQDKHKLESKQVTELVLLDVVEHKEGVVLVGKDDRGRRKEVVFKGVYHDLYVYLESSDKLAEVEKTVKQYFVNKSKSKREVESEIVEKEYHFNNEDVQIPAGVQKFAKFRIPCERYKVSHNSHGLVILNKYQSNVEKVILEHNLKSPEWVRVDSQCNSLERLKEKSVSEIRLRGLNIHVQTEIVSHKHQIQSIAASEMRGRLLNGEIASNTQLRHISLQKMEEKVIVSKFMAFLQLIQPDYLVSHSLTFDLKLLLSKCKQYSVSSSHLSKAGVLHFDTTNLSKELVSAQNDYSLQTLSKTFQLQRGSVLGMQEALFDKLGCFNLTKELTLLSGNLWQKTLLNGRAERVEYLLLHEFFNKGLLLPEKHARHMKTEYKGGLVLEPQAGLYNSKILLLDFNSLYPSIIQEFQLCFTNSDKVLPSILYTLVERRKAVKKLLSKAPSDQTLDMRQKALKLIANSLYGCLGFTKSRFYNPSIAREVTRKGREILKHTQTIVENCGLNVEVIYGDTDSLMINTKLGADSEEEVGRMSKLIRREVNKQYKVLELGQDGVFDAMLLLKKKKYAALLGSRLEIKGLDMVRRDWSTLSKNTGHKILYLILNGRFDEVYDIVSSAKELLQKLQARENYSETVLAQCVITKQLTKNISAYNTKVNLPHVEVAKRMALKSEAGSFVPYVMCQNNQPYHPSEVLSNQDLLIDTKYYIKNQILQPVLRLIQPVQEVNVSRVYEILDVPYTVSRPSEHAPIDQYLNVFDYGKFVSEEFAQKYVGLECGFRCEGCVQQVVVERGWDYMCKHCGREQSAAYVQNNMVLKCRSASSDLELQFYQGLFESSKRDQISKMVEDRYLRKRASHYICTDVFQAVFS